MGGGGWCGVGNEGCEEGSVIGSRRDIVVREEKWNEFYGNIKMILYNCKEKKHNKIR